MVHSSGQDWFNDQNIPELLKGDSWFQIHKVRVNWYRAWWAKDLAQKTKDEDYIQGGKKVEMTPDCTKIMNLMEEDKNCVLSAVLCYGISSISCDPLTLFKQVIYIVIPNTFRTIGNGAFFEYKRLKSVIIPDFV